jgi:hypothetical protein
MCEKIKYAILKTEDKEPLIYLHQKKKIDPNMATSP